MKNQKWPVILTLAFILSAGTAAAQEGLAWNDIVAQTKQHNPTLKKAEAAVQQAQANYKGSYSGFLPTISATAGTSQSETDPTGFSRSYSYGLSGSISLFSGFSDLSAVRVRDFELKIARASYNRSTSDVLFTVRKNFVQLLWAQNTVRLSEEILKQRTQNLNMIRLKYESGTENKGSLARVEADKLQAEYDLSKANRYLATARIALLRSMGLDDGTDITVRGELTAERPRVSDVKSLVAGTPEYRAARYSVDKADAQITQSKSNFFPSLTANGSTGKSGTAWVPDSNRWNLGLTLSFPLFSGGKDYYNLRVSVLNRTINESTLRETQETVETRLVSAYNDLIDSVDNVGVREKYLAASREQSTITTMKYINGLSSYQDWYTIENDFITSQRSLLNSQRDAALAAALWKNYLGEEIY